MTPSDGCNAGSGGLKTDTEPQSPQHSQSSNPGVGAISPSGKAPDAPDDLVQTSGSTYARLSWDESVSMESQKSAQGELGEGLAGMFEVQGHSKTLVLQYSCKGLIPLQWISQNSLVYFHDDRMLLLLTWQYLCKACNFFYVDSRASLESEGVTPIKNVEGSDQFTDGDWEIVTKPPSRILSMKKSRSMSSEPVVTPHDIGVQVRTCYKTCLL